MHRKIWCDGKFWKVFGSRRRASRSHACGVACCLKQYMNLYLKLKKGRRRWQLLLCTHAVCGPNPNGNRGRFRWQTNVLFCTHERAFILLHLPLPRYLVHACQVSPRTNSKDSSRIGYQIDMGQLQQHGRSSAEQWEMEIEMESEWTTTMTPMDRSPLEQD